MSTSDLLPWSWVVTPIDPSRTTCPSIASTLGTFAAVNIVTAMLSYFLGDFRIVRRITCGLFGKPTGKPWVYMWIVNIGLQLGSNAVIAVTMKNSPGYTSTFTVAQLVLLYAARPRFAWIVLGFVSELARRHPRSDNSGDWGDRPHGYVYPWRASFLSCMISEAVQQLIALYTMGVTAHFAAIRGYYVVNSDTYRSLPQPAHLMYGGALFCLVAGIGSLIALIFWLSINVMTDSPSEDIDEDGAWLIYIIILVVTMWLGSWLFWAGFVELAGDLYCPPSLISQGIIWTSANLLGVIWGTGVGS